MNFITWLFRLLVLAILILFAVQNTASVDLRFLPGHVWHAPLVVVLLAFFILGIALGVGTLLGTIYRQRREIARLKKTLEYKPEEPVELQMPPVL